MQMNLIALVLELSSIVVIANSLELSSSPTSLPLDVNATTSAHHAEDASVDEPIAMPYSARNYITSTHDIVSKVTFHCNTKSLNFLNAACNGLLHRQLSLTATFASMNDSLDILNDEKFLRGIRATPKAFIVSMEVDGGWRRLKNKWEKYLRRLDRPMILHFKNTRREVEQIYYLNGDDKLEYLWMEEKMNPRRLRENLDSKFNVENLILYLRYATGRGMNATYYYPMVAQAINRNCSLCVRIMHCYLADFNVTDFMQRYARVIAQKFNRDTVHALLDLPFTFNKRYMSNHTFDVIRKTRELLIEAVESDNLDGVKFLLDIDYVKGDDWENTTATTIAYRLEHFEIFLLLIKSDFPYPDNYAEIMPSRGHTRVNRALQELNWHIREIQQLHDDIRNGNTGRIERFIEDHPRSKYARDIDNIMAIVTAFYTKNLEVIAILNAHNMMPYDNGAARHIVNHIYSFNEDEILKLQQINLKYLNPPAEDHIMRLHAKTLIKFDISEIDELSASREVFYALTDLHRNEFTGPVIEYAAKWTNLQLVIDLSSRFTFKLNPVSYTSSGLTNEKEHRVYVGAKDILNPKDRDMALGIIIHEVMHYVMYLMYYNDAKPYTRWDEMTRKYFEMIEDVYKTRDEHREQWMVKVFQKYEPEQHQSELIARAVDLPVLYRTNITGMAGVRRAYKDLFEFYEFKIMPELKWRIENGVQRLVSNRCLLAIIVVVTANFALSLW